MSSAYQDFYCRPMLAPIAGVTDRATRLIARELGCPLAFSELISATGMAVGNRGTKVMLNSCRDEHPLVIQLFGKDPEWLGEATKIVTDMGPDGIDLNLGCPAKKVVNHGSGVALSRHPALVAEILSKMRQNTSLPLSVKIRAGWTHDELSFLEIGKIAQEEGVNGIIMHARTKVMGFTGEAFWPWIGELKAAVTVPVVGNGDVKDGPSAKKMIDDTGCDGVMVGRASYGNLWVFRDIQTYLETGLAPSPASLKERIEVIKRHIRYIVEDKGELKGVREMRKQVGWYLRGYPTVKDLRRIVNYQDKADDVISSLDTWAAGMPDTPPFPNPRDEMEGV